jgi:hypothetical protein
LVACSRLSIDTVPDTTAETGDAVPVDGVVAVGLPCAAPTDAAMGIHAAVTSATLHPGRLSDCRQSEAQRTSRHDAMLNHTRP